MTRASRRSAAPRLSSLRLLCAALLCAVFGGGAVRAQSGGIETLTGEMLFASGTRVSISGFHRDKGTIYSGSDEVANPLGRSSTETRTTLSMDHGLSSRLTVTALVPYVWKSAESGGTTLRSAGVGDVAVLAKFLIAHDYWRRSGWHVAAAAGVEMPTGSTSESEGGTRLTPGMQPGSGSWDPFLSLTANLELDLWRFDAIALYKDNTEGAQDYEDGDDFAFDLIGSYRFLHQTYPGDSANAKLGLLYRHEGSASLDGMTVANSGSEVWFGRFGLTWHPTPAWDINFTFDLPLASDYDGTQLGTDYQVALAIGLRF